MVGVLGVYNHKVIMCVYLKKLKLDIGYNLINCTGLYIKCSYFHCSSVGFGTHDP